jgi:two-component system, cell cycle sensor histidine kinase and response regulator CckA
MAVDSKAGLGTTFSFYLPAADGNIKDKPDRRKEAKTGNGRILVMDDREEMRNLVGDMMRFLGYDAEFASDGLDAVIADPQR